MREIPVPVFKHSDLNIFFLIFRYISNPRRFTIISSTKIYSYSLRYND